MTNEESFNSLTKAQWIDQACDRFETAWRAGQPVTIESILETSPESVREVLVNELVAIEIELRRKQGESLVAEEFVRRFPCIDPNVAGLAAAIASSSIDQPTIDSPGLARSRKHDDLTGVSIQYLGDYELLEQIARGGMGIVYKARQQSLGRIVAVKMILGGQFAEKQDIDRFHSEATAAAKLDHPGIVPIYEVGEQEGHHFYSMGFVEGGSLAQRLLEGPLPARESADLLAKIADAVHYAHLKGVIHRDIKPANILIDANFQPRVTDFGLAKLVKGSSDITRSGQILGTPSYMPPEQAAAQASAIGPASDVYSLGALLYSLLTGRPPFQAATPIETLLQVQKQEPVSPRQFNTNIPIDLETITLKCLDKSPARRYAAADDLALELRRYLAGKPILARPVSKAEQAWRWCRRNPAVASLATLIMLLISGIAVGSAWAYLRESALRKDLKVAFDNQKELTASERQAKLEEAAARKAADDAKVVADSATLDARNAAEVARKAAEEAEAARAEKERQAEIAEQEKFKAKTSEAQTRRNLYISDAARIAALIQEPNLNRAKTLLERHIPKSPDEEDLRGFDWYYLWRQVSQEKARFDFKKSVEVLDLSDDEKTLAVGCEGGRAYLLDVASGTLQDALFSIDDEHWSSLAFVGNDRLIGHGRQGGFKLWDRRRNEILATKPSAYAGQLVEDRMPATVSDDGYRMVCSDLANTLALWDLITLRPQPLLYINEGNHPFKRGGHVHTNQFFLSPMKMMQASVGRMDENLLTDSGLKNWDAFFVRAAAERASREYWAAGVMFSLPYLGQNLPNIGHPISALSISRDGSNLASGSVEGEIQLWDLQQLEDPTLWMELVTKKQKLSNLPIRSVAFSPDDQLLAACDQSSCQVFRIDELVSLLAIDVPEGELTKVTFLGSDRIAIGTDSGLLDIWSISETKQLRRYSTGRGSVSDIAVNKHFDRVYVSNTDGGVVSLDLDLESRATIPKRVSNASHTQASLGWIEGTDTLAFHRNTSQELVLVDPRVPQPVALLDLKGPGMNRLSFNDPRYKILFRQRKNGAELVSIHTTEINLWNCKTHSLIKSIDFFQHADGSGRLYPIVSNQHHHKGLQFKDGAFVNLPQLPIGGSRGIRSADLFSDERRLAMVVDGGHILQLFLRDLETGSVLSEIRILGASAAVGTPVLTCLDEQRVLIVGLTFVGNENVTDLLWDTTDDSVTSIDTLSETTSPVLAKSKFFHDENKIVNRAREIQQIAIWNRAAIRVLNADYLKPITHASAPDKQSIWFVHLDANGDLYAVLALSDAFRWAKWNRDSKEWQTIFESHDHWLFADAMETRWCFDSNHSMLLHMQEPGTFQRWNATSGLRLPLLQIPSGVVESIQIDSSGVIAAMLKSKVDDFTSPLSFAWYQKSAQIQSVHVADVRPGQTPFFLPLPASGQWLTRQGIQSVPSTDRPKEIVSFEGKPLDPIQPNSKVLLSEDYSCLVHLDGESLHQWKIVNEPDASSRFVYRYLSSTKVFDPRPADRALLTPDGMKIAILVGTDICWSEQPFHEWKKLALPVTSEAKVASLKWSWDNTTISVGFNSGDVMLHNVLTGVTSTLSRGHQGIVHDMAWLPDHLTIATAGNDGDIVIWDLAQKEIRLRIAAHRGAVKSLGFDATNNSLYSGGEDGYIRQWVAELKELADTSPTRSFEPPDPNAPFQEKKAAPSATLKHNRELINWLIQRSASYKIANYGIPLNLDESTPVETIEKIDHLSVHTIVLRGDKSLSDEDLTKLSGLIELRSLDLGDCDLSSANLKKLSGLFGLHTLDLSRNHLSKFDFESLKDSRNIQTLKLNQCAITDDQLLSMIRLFPELRELEISDATVSDESVTKIDSLANLKTLQLASSKITGKSIESIEKLSRLEKLDLSNTAISIEELSPLASLKLLQELRLQGIKIKGAWLSSLTHWRHLKKIDLRECDVPVTELAIFKSRRKNVDVYVSPNTFGDYPEIASFLELGPVRGSVQIDGKSLEVMAGIFKMMKGGSITGLTWPIDPNRSSEDIEVLARLPKLDRISIAPDAVPKIHFAVLPKIERLRYLEINSPPYFAFDELKPISTMTELKGLKTDSIYEGAFQYLNKLSNLQSLEYESGVEIDKIALAMPRLQTLACPEFDAVELAKAVPLLESLEVLSVNELPKENTWPIMAKLKDLKQIKLPSTVRSTDLKKLQAALPNVEVRTKK